MTFVPTYANATLFVIESKSSQIPTLQYNERPAPRRGRRKEAEVFARVIRSKESNRRAISTFLRRPRRHGIIWGNGQKRDGNSIMLEDRKETRLLPCWKNETDNTLVGWQMIHDEYVMYRGFESRKG